MKILKKPTTGKITSQINLTYELRAEGAVVNAGKVKINVGSFVIKSIQSIIKKHGDQGNIGRMNSNELNELDDPNNV